MRSTPPVPVPFPTLAALPLRAAAQGHDARVVAFWNRLVAFYTYVQDAVGAADVPHPSGVLLHPADDAALRAWCAAPLTPARDRQRATAFAWLDKGPRVADAVPMGTIHVLLPVAYPALRRPGPPVSAPPLVGAPPGAP